MDQWINSRGLDQNEAQHFWAFLYCVAQSDRWIRENASDNEVATIVAENHNLWRLFGIIPKLLRESPQVFSPNMLLNTTEDIQRGYNNQDGTLRVSRIRNTIHYVEKNEDNLVWLADACAFGLKRYFSKQEFGEDFCRAICGGRLLNHDDFAGPVSGFTIWDDGKISGSNIANELMRAITLHLSKVKKDDLQS